MNYTIGRDNLAITVHVPTPCKNSCKFCNIKDIYKDGVNCFNLLTSCKKLADTTVKEVVISGGEPMNDIVTLISILEIFKYKDVYINTCLLKENFNQFVTVVNGYDNVKGINVSRHGNSYEDDVDILNNIASDVEMLDIKKPVRINCVIQDSTDFDTILDRYVTQDICFRADYRNITTENLHTLNGIPKALLNMKMQSINRCNVCQTITFSDTTNKVMFHKGLEKTSIENDGNIKVNDIIVYPDGTICYDWDKEKVLDDFSFIENSGIGIGAILALELLKNGCNYSDEIHKLVECADCCGSRSVGGCGSGGCGAPIYYGGCGGGRSC